MKLFLLGVLMFPWSELKASEIIYIGSTEAGDELSHSLDEKDYERHLTETLASLDAVVDQHATKEMAVSGNKFRLSQIVLGLGASGEIGVGPFKLGAGIRHRTYYKRSL